MSVAVSKIDLIDRLFNDAGTLLAGGKVYTYVTSTTTPLATYTDASGDTAHDNPIVLDASGNTQIWFQQGASYKVIYTDANDVAVGETINGLVIPSLAGSGVTYVDLAFEVLDASVPTADQSLGAYTFTEAVTFPINFAGAHGKVLGAGTNPAATFTAVVKKNGTQVGTIVISTGGSFSFTTTGGATVSFSNGDLMEIYAPHATDSSLLLFAWTLRGTAA